MIEDVSSCTRRIEFDAGHRVVGHEGKCRHVHGHRYAVEVSCLLSGGGTDELGRTVDFGEVKREVGNWIDTFLDHGLILSVKDPLFDVLSNLAVAKVKGVGGTYIDDTQKVFAMEDNPTAENLAREILRVAREKLSDDLIVWRVRVYETPNCYADAIDTRAMDWVASK